MSFFPDEALPGWSTDWTVGDLWYRAIWDVRVINMFLRALDERSTARFGTTTTTPNAGGDRSMTGTISGWRSIYNGAIGQLQSGAWIDSGATLGSFDGSVSFANVVSYPQWTPLPSLNFFYYPREITTLTPTGSEVGGWKARYIGTGAGAGRIYSFNSTTGAWEDAGDNAGLPDRAYPDPVTAALPAGYPLAGTRAAYFTGEFLNNLRDLINLLTKKTGQGGVFTSSTIASGAKAYWSQHGRVASGGGTGQAAAEASYTITNDVSVDPLSESSINGTSNHCSLSAGENHIVYADMTNTFARSLQFYMLGIGGIDNQPIGGGTGGTPDFSNLYGLINGRYALIAALSSVGGGASVNTVTIGDVSTLPAWPPTPPVGYVSSKGSGNAISGGAFYYIEDFGIPGGFTYVSGYSGT